LRKKVISWGEEGKSIFYIGGKNCRKREFFSNSKREPNVKYEGDAPSFKRVLINSRRKEVWKRVCPIKRGDSSFKLVICRKISATEKKGSFLRGEEKKKNASPPPAEKRAASGKPEKV